MKQYVGSVYVDTETSQIFDAKTGKEIPCCMDIIKAYDLMNVFKKLKSESTEEYTDEIFWEKANEELVKMDRCLISGSLAVIEIIGERK